MFSSRKSSAPVSGGLLSKSLRFRSSASAYLNRTPSSSTNRQTWTWSGWVKRGLLGTPQYTLFSGGVTNTDTGWLGIFFYGDTFYVSGWLTYFLSTTQIFRDTSAWYHIVVALDTTQSTATNRIKVYVNGLQVTAFSTDNRSSITQNSNLGINQSANHAIGSQSFGTANYLDGYLTDINFIDGQALTPSSFASTNATTGQWSPAKYTGTYGTNGFHLTFANTTSTTTLGYDQSGNSNNWTTTGISLSAGATYDSMNDVPVAYSATAANYCVINPNANSGPTITNGNLNQSGSSGVSQYVASTMGMSASGKYYCELTCVTLGSEFSVGICTDQGSSNYVGGTSTSWGYYTSGNKYNNGSGSAYGATYTSGDLIGVAFDAGAGTLTFYKNGTSQGTAFTGLTSGTYFFTMSTRTSGGASTGTANFGQQPFTYTPPSGYNALNTYNLPTPSIPQGNVYMNAVLQLGSAVNTGANLFSQSGFTYGLAWGKDRTSSNNNQLVDTVRGTSNVIQSNTTSAETTYSAPTSSDNCVAWVWNAQNASGANSNGTINSTVSVSTTAGFSIVTWTYNGSGTIGHGLGAVPQMIIQKDRTSGTYNWDVYHVSIGNTKRAILNSSAIPDVENVWNNTTPTSSVFSIGSSWYTNGDNIVSYCFAPVAGFSSFGTYSGNSSNQFIYTGFQPKWVMVRLSGPSGGGSWTVFDTSRSPYNLEALRLQPNSSNAEASTGSNGINGLSNGFQLVGDYNGGDTNLSGYTYIYAAFASNPFAYSNAF